MRGKGFRVQGLGLRIWGLLVRVNQREQRPLSPPPPDSATKCNSRLESNKEEKVRGFDLEGLAHARNIDDQARDHRPVVGHHVLFGRVCVLCVCVCVCVCVCACVRE